MVKNIFISLPIIVTKYYKTNLLSIWMITDLVSTILLITFMQTDTILIIIEYF